ncbi:MAG: magnesium transporter [Gammaproteobacteria bacterium]
MPDSQRRLDEALAHVRGLLNKQHIVEHMVHAQRQRKQELVESLTHRQMVGGLEQVLRRMHVADIAHLLEALPQDERMEVWAHVASHKASPVLLEVDEAVRPALLMGQDRERLRAILEPLDGDELAWVADDLPADVLAECRAAMSEADRQWLADSLHWGEDSVGFLMTPEMIRVRESWSVEQAIAHMRGVDEVPSHTDKLFVVNHLGVLTGVVPLQTLLTRDPECRLADVMARGVVTFQPEESGEDAGHAFERYDLISAPVVDERGKLMGRLTVDVVMEHLHDQVQEDALNSVGLEEGEDLFAPVWRSARNRWLWVALNLLTAFVASRVIGAFEHTISQMVALAALMPIVASMGGNTGNQTTALVIRGLALHQIDRDNRTHVLRKELAIALLNGLVWGGVVGLFTWVFYGDVMLMMVISVATVFTLLIAALSGVGVPLILERMGRDPAMGSSVLLTATTDTLGFLVFLGLASLVLV